MTMANFIPKIWAKQLEWDFEQAVIARNLVSTKYEGEAKAGNTVTVNTGEPIQVKDYKTGVLEDELGNKIPRTTAPDDVGTVKQDLLIDQEKSVDFRVDDIDRAQAAGDLGGYTDSAGRGLATDVDMFLLAMISGADAHLPASAITTGDQAFNILRDLRKALNKRKVPQGNRVAVINAEFEGLLLEAGSKITNVDKSGSPAGMREASIGRLLGFDIYMSENTPVTSKPQILTWYTPRVAFVSQVTEMEPMRDQNKFADRIRGLHVYGGKVMRDRAGVATGVKGWTAS